jgi:choline transport protein
MFAKRCRGEKLPPSRFDLGKLGFWINGAALCWLALLLVFLSFPSVPNPTPA